ncbi:hypothetical protein ACP4OV_011503 [Aristida adscensionis]
MPPHRYRRGRRRRYEPSARSGPRGVWMSMWNLRKSSKRHHPSLQLPRPPMTPRHHQSAAFTHLLRHVFWPGTILIGDTHTTLGQGFFHTYPVLDGPYHSLQEADKAIDRHLDERRHPKMRRLYWPDGTSKRRSKSQRMEKAHDHFSRLVLDLLDKYNEDHNLLGDLTWEFKHVLHYETIAEEASLYDHLNFIATSKADGDVEVFAEVKHLMQGNHVELIICCFCVLDPTDKGQHCNGCTIIGNVDMKHPDSTVPLAAGHMDPRSQFGGQLIIEESDSEDEDTYLKTREAELRHIYRGFEEPRVMERLHEKYFGTPAN